MILDIVAASNVTKHRTELPSEVLYALEAQAQAAVRVALEKYGRHIEGVCDISVDTSYPRDSRCTCGLRELVEAL